MQMNESDLREFMRIYEQEFGEELQEDEAREIASNLLSLYEALMQPLPSGPASLAQEAPRHLPDTAHLNPEQLPLFPG